MKNTLVFLLCLTPLTAVATRKVASISQDLRIGHARELMGSNYHKSVVSKFDNEVDLESKILSAVTKNLPKIHRSKANIITNAIIEEATSHSLDPYFLMAVISGESSFNPEAIGPVGEIGLMQIRPQTGEWMAKKIKLTWMGDKTLRDPVLNIKLGAAYLAWLREKFSGQGQLYLAAYNMGASSVKKALARNIRPKDYTRHVMKRYLAFYRAINVAL